MIISLHLQIKWADSMSVCYIMHSEGKDIIIFDTGWGDIGASS